MEKYWAAKDNHFPEAEKTLFALPEELMIGFKLNKSRVLMQFYSLPLPNVPQIYESVYNCIRIRKRILEKSAICE